MILREESYIEINIMQFELKQEAFKVEAVSTNVHNLCFDACVKDVKDKDLKMDEVKCVERCSIKYLQTHRILQNALQKSNTPLKESAKDKKKRK